MHWEGKEGVGEVVLTRFGGEGEVVGRGWWWMKAKEPSGGGLAVLEGRKSSLRVRQNLLL